MINHRAQLTVGLVLIVVAALLGFYLGSHNNSESKSPSTPDPKTVTCTAWENLSVHQKDIIAKALTSSRGRIDAGCGTSDNPDNQTASEYAH